MNQFLLFVMCVDKDRMKKKLYKDSILFMAETNDKVNSHKKMVNC